jgi:hypothetical protein
LEHGERGGAKGYQGERKARRRDFGFASWRRYGAKDSPDAELSSSAESKRDSSTACAGHSSQKERRMEKRKTGTLRSE